MSPMVWLFGLCSLVFIPVNLTDPDPPVLYTVLALWALSGLAGIGGFAYLMFTAPHRLQNQRRVERTPGLHHSADVDSL